MKPEGVTQGLQEAAKVMKAAKKAQQILDPERPQTYSQALESLFNGTREWWEEELEDEESKYTPAAKEPSGIFGRRGHPVFFPATGRAL